MVNQVTIINHPLIKHKLSMIRDKNTNTTQFRALVSEVGGLMAYEVTRNLQTREIEVETPIAMATSEVLKKDLVIVPILRAGLGMVDGITNLIPTAKIAHIGMYRDEKTLQPHVYYAKFPVNIAESTVLLVDPMLATGGSAINGVNILKEKGCKEIIFVGLVGAPEGILAMTKAHPDVPIFLASKDERLNENGYIVPGLGDCGDRIFGTK